MRGESKGEWLFGWRGREVEIEDCGGRTFGFVLVEHCKDFVADGAGVFPAGFDKVRYVRWRRIGFERDEDYGGFEGLWGGKSANEFWEGQNVGSFNIV